MQASASDISNSSYYGYGFVVSITEASINSGLKSFLLQQQHPIRHLCFLADENGNPTKLISLAELQRRAGGANPFDLPHDTPANDKRVLALTAQGFYVGILLQLGLPQGVEPGKLPPIVTLTSSARVVNFNLFCSQLVVIQNRPADGFGHKAKWDVWTQTGADAWHFATKVNLVLGDLDKNLNTSYLQKNPVKKEELRKQLVNTSSSTVFGLRQLFFALDQATLQDVPQIKGLDSSSPAYFALHNSFVGAYAKTAMDQGLPMVAVVPDHQSSDPSSLRMTSFEMSTSLYKDFSGHIDQHANGLVHSASTLNYLCAIDNHKLPPPTTDFIWNWVYAGQVRLQSGTLAISRSVMADILMKGLKETFKWFCVGVMKTYHTGADGGIKYLEPQHSRLIPTNKNGLIGSLTFNTKEEQEDPYFWKTISTMEIKVRGEAITIQTVISLDSRSTLAECYKYTRIENCKVSIDQNGRLNLVTTRLPEVKTWTNRDDPLASGLDRWANQHFIPKAKTINLSNFQKVILPGSKVFAYKSAFFSESGDLVCAITHQNLDNNPASQGASHL